MYRMMTSVLPTGESGMPTTETHPQIPGIQMASASASSRTETASIIAAFFIHGSGKIVDLAESIVNVAKCWLLTGPLLRPPVGRHVYEAPISSYKQ
jgi:hypothetical protein